jgi:prepilin-type N-terminal cleavage/methylation domain-containing protein
MTNRAFTIVELLVTITLSAIVISAAVGTYSAFRKAVARDHAKVSIAQNARVAFDRMSREVRQTPDVVTEFPVSSSDVLIAQPGEIEFEDGHAQDLTYHRYYVSGSVLKMDTLDYYFASASSKRVKAGSVGAGGITPVRRVLSTQDIAENVHSLSFYGGKPVEFIMITADGFGQTFTVRTKLFERNL